MASLPALPASLKPVQHYMKIAIEHDVRDQVVAYYCRLYALQRAMEIDKKSTEARTFIVAVMDLLEKTKKELGDHEAIKSELVGQAHCEEYALKLFLYADNEDRAGRFGKNVVKSYYTSAMIIDIMSTFGDISEELQKNRKYARWKATYIHNCLKNGEMPIAGPLATEGQEGFEEFYASEGAEGGAYGGPPTSTGPNQYQQPSGPNQSHQSHLMPGPSHQTGQPTVPQPNLPSPGQAPHAPPTTPSDPRYNTVPQEQYAVPAGGVHLGPNEYQRAMKYCKYAGSALQYEDTKTAVDNLEKALRLLKTGRE